MPSAAKDSHASWIIAFACCFVNFLLDGLGRLAGIFFVATLSTFSVSRQSAALPFSLCTAIRNLTGPVVGFLGAKYGVRPVTIAGGILSSVGIGLCFFATDVIWMTVSWGIIFGIGYGLGNILLPVAINENFNVHRATASGISFSGGCFGSLALPWLLQLLLDEFELHGLCLLTSGIILHCIPAALLLKPPDPLKPINSPSNACHDSETVSSDWRFQFESDSSDFSSAVPEDIVSYTNDSQVSSGRASGELYCNKTLSDDSSSIGEDLGIEMSPPRHHPQLKFKIQVIECTVIYKSKFPSMPHRMGNSMTNGQLRRPHSNSLPSGCYDNVTFTSDAPDFLRQLNSQENQFPSELYTVTEERDISLSNRVINNDLNKANDDRNTVKHLKIFTNLCFLSVTVFMSLYEFVFIAMITVIIDYSKDLGIPKTNSKWLLVAFSIGDLFGRLCFGWVTDKKMMSRTCFTSLCFLGFGTAIVGVSYSSDLCSLMSSFVAYGTFESGALIMFPLLMAQYVKPEEQAVAIASSNLFPGLIALTVPSAIGFFRDEVGSYIGLFYILEVASVISSILCLSLPWMALRQRS